MAGDVTQKRRTGQLAGLYTISQILSNTLDLDTVLQQLVMEAARLLGAPECTVSLLDGDFLKVARSSNVELSDMGQVYSLNDFPLTAAAVRQRAPIAIKPDTANAEEELLLLTQFGYQSLVVAPIVFGHTPLGILEVYSRQADYFNTEDIDYLQAIANQAATAIRNALLYQETERQAEEIDLLYRISQSVRGELSLDAVLQQIARQVTRALRVSGCTISRYVAIQDHLVTLLDYEPDSPPEFIIPTGTIYKLADYPQTRQVIDTQQSVLLQRQDADLDPAEEALMIEADVETLLMLPLVVGGRVVGLLEVYQSDSPRWFTLAELRLAERLSVDIAGSLENAHLFQQSQEQMRQMAVLSAIQHALMSVLAPAEILSEVIRQVHFFLRVDGCSVFLYDSERDCLDLAITADPDLRDKTLSIPADKGLAGRAMQSRRSILVNDTVLEPEHQGVLPGSQMQIRSLLSAPLVYQNEALGVIQVVSSEVGAFNESQLTLLDSVASATAIALENARLHASVDRNQRQLQAILDSTADSVIAVDASGKIRLFNPAAQKLFALSKTDAIGRPATEILAMTDLPDALVDLERQTTALELDWPDGRTFLAALSEMVSGAGHLHGKVIVLHDITYLKELEQMKNEFVSTVSHDLKNPITIIQGFSALLSELGPLNSDQHEIVGRIAAASTRMLNLVTDLLDLGKIEAGLALNEAPCNLTDITRDVIHQLADQAAKKAVEFDWALADKVPISGDRERLEQVVYNLVHNAIKYTPSGGTVSVVVDGGEAANLVVSDSGYGIPAADLPHIFDKFYRVATAEVREIEGTGLGLAIVKAIIDQHNGQLIVKSTVGQGSTFHVRLPVA